MHFSDRDPMDLPPPPTVDEVAAHFSVPVMAFILQPAVEMLGVGTVSSSSNGESTTIDSLSLSYVVWRNPEDHADPLNLAGLSDTVRNSLDAPLTRTLPDWMMSIRELMRYPSLWEAVTTTRTTDEVRSSPGSTLVDHVNHVVRNTFRAERVAGGIPGELDSPVTERHIQPVTVRVDGVGMPGMLIDTDPSVYAVGADLGDRMLTAVVAREYLPYLTMEFRTRVALPPHSGQALSGGR
jgi:hypothetical protein